MSIPAKVTAVLSPRARVLRPYIAALASEQPELAHLTLRGDGSLGYADEREDDRDNEDGLWTRVPEHSDAVGQVENWRPHPRRQRHLMSELLCQICAGPPARSADGWLFVLPGGPESPSDGDTQWGEGLIEATPPVCRRDARLSVKRCPSLGQAVALWVKRPILYGIYGTTYRLGPRGIERQGAGIAKYETPALGWTVATQMVRELTGTRIDRDLTVRLRALHARHAAAH